MQQVDAHFSPPPLAQRNGFDVNTTPHYLASLLQARCGVAPLPSSPGTWALAPRGRIATEQELLGMVGPDAVVSLEALRAGLMQMDAAGLQMHDELARGPLDKMHLIAQVRRGSVCCKACSYGVSVRAHRSLHAQIRLSWCFSVG